MNATLTINVHRLRKPLLYGFALVVHLSLTACVQKYALDDEVRRLCAIDGGKRVFETVSLSPEKLDKYGRFRPPMESDAKPTDEYYVRSYREYLERGNPEMWRRDYKIVRRSDGKILGEDVSYTRHGGDPPGPWHDSAFSCPPIEKDSLSIEEMVFVRKRG